MFRDYDGGDSTEWVEVGGWRHGGVCGGVEDDEYESQRKAVCLFLVVGGWGVCEC